MSEHKYCQSRAEVPGLQAVVMICWLQSLISAQPVETNCCGVWISFRDPNIRQAKDVVRMKKHRLVFYLSPGSGIYFLHNYIDLWAHCWGIFLYLSQNHKLCEALRHDIIFRAWQTGSIWLDYVETRQPGLPLWCSESPGCIYPALGITLPGTLSNKTGPTLIWEIALKLLLRFADIKVSVFMKSELTTQNVAIQLYNESVTVSLYSNMHDWTITSPLYNMLPVIMNIIKSIELRVLLR